MMIFKKIMILWISLIMIVSGGSNAEQNGKETFSVAQVGKIISFAHNSFRIHAEEGGLLTIRIHDGKIDYRILQEKIDKGETLLEWDGCGFNQERLIQMTYQISATLEGDSGSWYEDDFQTLAEYNASALLFVLTSGETVYLSDMDEWFIETKPTISGILFAEFYRENEEMPCITYQREIDSGRINKLTFSALCGKRIPEIGKYRIRCYERNNPEFDHWISISVEEKKPAGIPVQPTGEIMPDENASDEEIWQAMTRPGVVVDLPELAHQKVFCKKDEKSDVLGTLHGQTQCVSVLEISGIWARIRAWNHEEGEKIEGWVPLERLKVVEPQIEYGLLINKKKQTLTVFHEGERWETLMISSGRMEKGQLYQETAAGIFLTGEHRIDFSTNGLKYDYVIQYDGGNLLHQIPYAWGGKKDFSVGRSYLGTKASHACVRIQAEPGREKGINAYWLWTHIPVRTKLIIMDDPEERRGFKKLLEGAEKGKDDSYLAVDEDEEATFSKDAVRITFGGDAVPGGREVYFSRPDSLMAIVAEKGIAYPLSGLAPIFRQDDLTSVNLECVLKDTKDGEDISKQYRFRGPMEYVGILEAGSVEMVNVANNHTIDYGEEGFTATLQALEGRVAYFGKEKLFIRELKGHRFGFAGCRETDYLEDNMVIHRDIERLKEAGCEVIIYQCHWGKEYAGQHNKLQEAMARTCVREGADLVIGHHPHVVQGIDWIEGVPVVYSLGNLFFGGTIHLQTYDALVVQALFSFEEEGTKTAIRLIPILTSSKTGEKKNDYCPVVATGDDRKRIFALIQADTSFPVHDWIMR